jgi:hypothetical protein
MTDMYSKLLGLSDKPNPPETEKPKKEPDQQLREEKTSLLENQQTSKLARKQASKEVNNHIHLNSSEKQQEDTSLLLTKDKKKYGTYLTALAIEKIRIHAIQTDRDDHQVLQEAVNRYFENLEN